MNKIYNFERYSKYGIEVYIRKLYIYVTVNYNNIERKNMER